MDNSSSPRKRGFALLDAARKKEIGSMGGRAAQASGNARKFDSESAKYASMLSKVKPPMDIGETHDGVSAVPGVSSEGPGGDMLPEPRISNRTKRSAAARRDPPKRATSSDDLEASMSLRRAQLKRDEREKREAKAAFGKASHNQRRSEEVPTARPRETEATKQLLKNLAAGRRYRNGKDTA